MLSSPSRFSKTRLAFDRCDDSISRLIFSAAAELTRANGDEIGVLIRRTVEALAEIEHVERAAWCLLLTDGTLLDIFPCRPDANHSSFVPTNILRASPSCIAQLRAGNSVVLDSGSNARRSSDYVEAYPLMTRMPAVALLPAACTAQHTTVLLLCSSHEDIEWSRSIAEQGTLLANLLSNSYQRTLAEDVSHRLAQTFHKLVIAGHQPMALVDGAGKFISVNVSFQELLGYSGEELMQTSYSEIVCLAHRRQAEFTLRQSAQRGGAIRKIDQVLTRKDRRRVSAVVSLARVEGSSVEDAISVLGVEPDIQGTPMESLSTQHKPEIDALAGQLIRSQENDRKRLSRELHDDIGQRLSLAASEAAALAAEQSSSGSSAGRLGALRDELDTLCTDIHSLSHNLHSYKLQHLGLGPAVKDLCRQFSQSHFAVEFHLDEFEEPVSKDVALCLYRIAQEALNNALHHAHTSSVSVTIRSVASIWYLTVRDYGVGFDDVTDSDGLGLISMRERARLVNGELQLHSSLGKGTEIWVAVPDPAAV